MFEWVGRGLFMKKIMLTTAVIFLGTACSNNFNAQKSTSGNTSLSCNGNECEQSAIMMKDQFERTNVLINTTDVTDELTFWWRKIINDWGKVISGQAGNNVDVRIFNEPTVGPGSDDGSALYFYGRQGRSVHNIYLVSQTFDLHQAERVEISFKYLAIDLEESEYLKLEVCRSTPEDCGVGDQVTAEGLNTNNWETLFESDNSLHDGFTGKDHTAEDWKAETVSIDIDPKDLRTFIFRFNARMDNGFSRDDQNNPMIDGVGLDEVTAVAYRRLDNPDKGDDGGSNEEVPDPDFGVDPFDPDGLPFDLDDPRLFD